MLNNINSTETINSKTWWDLYKGQCSIHVFWWYSHFNLMTQKIWKSSHNFSTLTQGDILDEIGRFLQEPLNIVQLQLLGTEFKDPGILNRTHPGWALIFNNQLMDYNQTMSKSQLTHFWSCHLWSSEKKQPIPKIAGIFFSCMKPCHAMLQLKFPHPPPKNLSGVFQRLNPRGPVELFDFTPNEFHTHLALIHLRLWRAWVEVGRWRLVGGFGGENFETPNFWQLLLAATPED